MRAICFSLKLISDAEPGTGFGGELVNDLIPRDEIGRPVLPASHIKGLMRAALVEMCEARGWSRELIVRVFGKPEHVAVDEYSAFTLTSAAAMQYDCQQQFVVRTAVGEAGIALVNSLRTTEFVSSETEFSGCLYISSEENSVEDLACRLSLLSIRAVGGGRNRGSGACFVTIQSETQGPGTLLRELDRKMRTWKPSRDAVPSKPISRSLVGKATVLKLVFRASTPICCPEIPDRSNVISTGFTIPASAVQGALLTYINQQDPELATALFEHSQFRAWPLQPCGKPNHTGSEPQPCSSIRVSLTHQASKYSVADNYGPDDFHERALVLDTSEDRPRGAPLKASDGVLLRYPDGSVKLWRASDMPHVITSHGVHEEAFTERKRNLFTVDAMAPMVWQGLVVAPEDAIQDIQRILGSLPQIAIGKSRTVRGLGTISIDSVLGVPEEWKTPEHLPTLFVVQSPIPIPDTSQSVEEQLRSLADSWKIGVEVEKVWASSGILFGWNRLRNGLQQAQRVILPGSVIAFKKRIEDQVVFDFLTSAKFMQENRQRGYGAISVHPGKATSLLEFKSEPLSIQAAQNQYADAIKLVLQIARMQVLPSVSQIRSIKDRLDLSGVNVALEYLQNQTTGRTARIWADWDHCKTKIHDLISKFPVESSSKALDVLADLILAAKGQMDS
jgi:hypothetical protein